MTRAQEQTILRLRADLEALASEHRELAVVVDSVREIVKCGWVYRQEPCPFCRGVFNHRAHCYLNSNAGAQILVEYAEIERQRDFLLAQVKRLNGETPQGKVRRSLKSRLRRNGTPPGGR